MRKNLILKVVLGWLGMAIAGVVNGMVRNWVYLPVVGDLVAHQISTGILMVVLVGVVYVVLGQELVRLSDWELWRIGAVWVGMTILFEFGAGHYLFRNSWQKLWADYDLTRGRVWLLVLVTELAAPIVLKRLMSLKGLEPKGN